MDTETYKAKAIEHILLMEGGYVNNPSDPGGETNFGISKRSYPDLDIAALTKSMAATIYSRDYWDVCKCSFLPAPLALAVVDYAVNSGTTRAVKALQSLIGTVVDGIVGPKTISSAHEMYDRQGINVVRWYNTRRLLFVSKLSTFNIFGKAWVSRILSVTVLATRWHIVGEVCNEAH